MPLSIESEIDLLYHLSTMSEHVLPKGMFYLLLWKRLNQSGHPPAFSFNEMIEHLRILYDESVFDNPELPSSNDHDFEWEPIKIDPPAATPTVVPISTPSAPPSEPSSEKDSSEKIETTPVVTKTRKRASSPSSNNTTPSTPNTESGRRSSRQRNPLIKEDDDQSVQASPQPATKTDKRKSVKEPSRASTRASANQDSIGTRLRAQK